MTGDVLFRCAIYLPHDVFAESTFIFIRGKRLYTDNRRVFWSFIIVLISWIRRWILYSACCDGTVPLTTAGFNHVFRCESAIRKCICMIPRQVFSSYACNIYLTCDYALKFHTSDVQTSPLAVSATSCCLADWLPSMKR